MGADVPADPGQLHRLATCLAASADDWVAASCAAKGWSAIPHALAEEWASGPLPVARFLAHLATRGAAKPPATNTPVLAVPPIPGRCEGLALRGHRAWVERDADVAAGAPVAAGGHALVLGAGNVTATPLLDVLDQVFVRGRRVTLKPSPLHRDLAATFATVLAPLVDAGWLAFADGDAAAGRALGQRDDVTAIHLTGSAATWAALRGDPMLRGKQLSAEVGCCTPALVVPGPWRDAELRAAARQLAAYTAANGGATCLAPRVLLTARGWPQRQALLGHLRAALAALPARVPFHPSVRADFATATGRPSAPDALPPTLCADLGAAEAALCDRELFAPVLREFALPGDDAPRWLANATDFVAAHCFGALSAYLFAPAGVLRGEREPLAAAVARLPHGTIATNTWTGLGYGLGTVPWGVPPGSAVAHGSGWTRDTLGGVRRVHVRAPLLARPLPPWLPAHRRGAAALRALTRHSLVPTARSLATFAAHAVRP